MSHRDDEVSSVVQVEHRPERGRFQARVDGHLCVADYRLDGDRMQMTHTEVHPALEGRGIAARLVRAALDHARANGLKLAADVAPAQAPQFLGTRLFENYPLEKLVPYIAWTPIFSTWASCSPGCGSRGVLDRRQQLKPKVLFCVDGYRYGGKPFDRRSELAEIIGALEGLEQVIFLPHLDKATTSRPRGTPSLEPMATVRTLPPAIRAASADWVSAAGWNVSSRLNSLAFTTLQKSMPSPVCEKKPVPMRPPASRMRR